MDLTQRLSIELIAASGQPLQPSEHAIKFVNQCGVLARDYIPITVQEWNKPSVARAGVRYVSDRAKEDLWNKLMANFNLPSDYQEKDEESNPDPEGKANLMKVKKFALKKMAEAFRNFKKNLCQNIWRRTRKLLQNSKENR